MDDLKARISTLTPEQRARLALSLGNKRAAHPDAGPQPAPDSPPVLSFAQQQLWFLEQLSPGNTSYNVPLFLQVSGELNVPALQGVLHEIVGRYKVLRTRFAVEQGEPKPVVASEWSVELKRHDLRAVPDPAREQEAQRLQKCEEVRPFDLSRDLMLRTMLIQTGDREHILFHNSHHIAWDLRSKAVFYRELEALYDACRTGRPSPLSGPAIQYSDYALWHRDSLRGPKLDQLTTYWKERLAGARTKLELPADHSRPPMLTLRGVKLPALLPRCTLDTARALSVRRGVTLFTTMLAAFAVFLYSYTGQEDILISSPGDGRDRPETRDLIGFFINTVVLRVRLDSRMSFRQVARAARDATLGALEQSQLPFHKVVEAVRPPLFQVNFRLQPGAPTTLRLAGLKVEGPYVIDNAAAKFDLALELPSVEGAAGFWEYSTDLFERETVARMAGDFDRLVTTLLAQPAVPLENTDLVTRFRRPGDSKTSGGIEQNRSPKGSGR